MAAPGWYTDENDNRFARWWDGSRWTDHVRPAGTPDPPLDTGVPVGTAEVVRLSHKALEVVGDGRRISIRGKVFDLGTVDRVAYIATRRKVNGSYMGTAFSLSLGQGDTKEQFIVDSGWRDKQLEEYREAWNALVDMVEATASPRIAEQAVATIGAGGNVRYTNVVVGPQGLQARRPLASLVPWGEVLGTKPDGVGNLRVLVRGRSAKPKMKFLVPLGGWNTVVLPRVVARLATGP